MPSCLLAPEQCTTRFDPVFELKLNELCFLFCQTQTGSPPSKRTTRSTQQHPNVCWIMFDLYLTLILMLNSLEYLLPLCGVYCVVIISVDRWTNYCKEFGERILIFFLYWSKLVVRGKKIKKTVSDVVYIDLHNSRVCWAGEDMSMDSKDDW